MQFFRRALLWPVLALAASVAPAQTVGPDVIVGELIDTANYGAFNGIRAYAVGTYSCNIGNAQLNWIAGNNQHPVIGQNLYRYFPGSASTGAYGRFELVGISWLKHGFLALTDSLCDTCQPPGTGGTTLGIGCADPYVASLNGNTGGLGPRFEVNPFTGGYPYPFTGATGNSTIAGRLQVAQTDVDLTVWPGASYFAEGQYVTADEAAAGHHFNNASWRPATMSNFSLGLTGATRREQPAIYAWKEQDGVVGIQTADVPGEGRFYVGYRVTPLGGGLFHHEYAVQNLNSDRAGGSFSVALPPGVSASAEGFHDVAYHSGEPFVGTDWAVTNTAGSSITWACETQAANANANALRWGTLYNFRFDSTADWLPDMTLGLWKAGSPSALSVQMCRQPSAPQTVLGGNYTQSVGTYQLIDASGGTPGPAGDDVGMTVALPFPFNFYGQPLASVVISTNGYLAAAGQPGDVALNAPIPDTVVPNGIIAGYWDDLEVGTAGGATGAATGWCRYMTTGFAPFRKFVVQWHDAERWNTNAKVSFEIILSETTSLITLTTISTTGGPFPTTGGSATRGVENLAGTLGRQVSFDAAGSVVAGTSINLFYQTSVVPNSADLEMSGDGSVANPFVWSVLSSPSSPLTLFFDLAPGPSGIPGVPSFGLVGLGLSPALTALADGTGVFGPLDPTAVTSSCGEWSKSLAISPLPLPPEAFDVYFQALVWNLGAPNGLAHLSTVVNY
jgi:hypothetical protein